MITGVLFTVGKFLISLYLGMSTVASSFGAAASIITILLWVVLLVTDPAVWG